MISIIPQVFNNNPAALNETTYPVCLSGHPEEEVENDEDDQKSSRALRHPTSDRFLKATPPLCIDLNV